jgi:hypothetical protein
MTPALLSDPKVVCAKPPLTELVCDKPEYSGTTNEDLLRHTVEVQRALTVCGDRMEAVYNWVKE